MPSFFLRAGAGPALALGLAACATYSPGSYRAGDRPFAGQHLTIDCLDLAIAADRDPVANGPVLDYQFGNRCDRAVPVDLGAVRATGRTADGHEVALVPYDPYREIRPLRLEARSHGRERLEYRRAVNMSTDLVQVCVALDGITARGAGAGQLCFDNPNRIAQVAP